MASAFRIVFFATPEFAVPTLGRLLSAGEEIAAVVTRPDRPRGRGRHTAPPPIKVAAERAGVAVLQPEKLGADEFRQAFWEMRPDLALVVAYGRIIPSSVFEMPRCGGLNVHPSLLPSYRGAAPIEWALIRGETETGVTLHRLVKEMDAGDVLLQEKIRIAPEDDAVTLEEKLARVAADLTLRGVTMIRSGKPCFMAQDPSGVTLAPALKKEDGRIDWSESADQIRNRIRAFTAWPGAFTTWRGRRLIVFSADALPAEASVSPGVVLLADREGIVVGTGDGMLRICVLQIEGGRRMEAAEFLLGHRIAPGEELGGAGAAT